VIPFPLQSQGVTLKVRGSVGLPVSQDALASKPCPSPGSREPGEGQGSTKEAGILLSARGLRAVLDGLVSLVLPVYLLALGYGPLETGIIATATPAPQS
jgi:hypothetical protein